MARRNAGRLRNRQHAAAACGGSTFESPVLTAITIVASIVVVTRTDFRVYFAATQFINFLLGPATVALAIPAGAERPAR
ncbi:LrgB family protein [Bradyrhizobium centrolobii]|uniref:LrgB family protein n=1 Tax=Bradyrhizobium centrolobii TaxID=1505087 RepID=UPI0024C047E4|nr:LrgB family protein [Bradyrhizobium centrolobii]